MASLSNYLEAELLDHVLRNSAYTPPTTIYAALFSTAVDETGSGTEAVGGLYDRQPVTFTASGSARTNTGAITFSSMPAGTWTHIALFDDDLAGEMLLATSLSSSQETLPGDDVILAIGELSVTFD